MQINKVNNNSLGFEAFFIKGKYDKALKTTYISALEKVKKEFIKEGTISQTMANILDQADVYIKPAPKSKTDRVKGTDAALKAIVSLFKKGSKQEISTIPVNIPNKPVKELYNGLHPYGAPKGLIGFRADYRYTGENIIDKNNPFPRLPKPESVFTGINLFNSIFSFVEKNAQKAGIKIS